MLLETTGLVWINNPLETLETSFDLSFMQEGVSFPKEV